MHTNSAENIEQSVRNDIGIISTANIPKANYTERWRMGRDEQHAFANNERERQTKRIYNLIKYCLKLKFLSCSSCLVHSTCVCVHFPCLLWLWRTVYGLFYFSVQFYIFFVKPVYVPLCACVCVMFIYGRRAIVYSKYEQRFDMHAFDICA